MPRWRQDPKTLELIPVGQRNEVAGSVAIHADFEPFISPIDGTVISDRAGYREHCKRHNVVPQAEFSDEFLAKKRAERERLFKGEYTREERLEVKREIYEAMVRAENGY